MTKRGERKSRIRLFNKREEVVNKAGIASQCHGSNRALGPHSIATLLRKTLPFLVRVPTFFLFDPSIFQKTGVVLLVCVTVYESKVLSKFLVRFWQRRSLFKGEMTLICRQNELLSDRVHLVATL